MKLRLDEYYYILNENYGLEEIEDYMPDDIADKYLEFCESHNSDEVDDYLEKLNENIINWVKDNIGNSFEFREHQLEAITNICLNILEYFFKDSFILI